ncbi:MAG TPA: Re/Si-specific NAD(P)(+) transhydrogenase subunit alpha [Gemmataceae bacterium]|nr:Re/Si-specific NAD(P)(+) transhydrogenase subunit alpha [Gemmataceae bacterium]
MIVGVPRETQPDERRVALVPELLPRLVKAGLEVHVQTGAGEAAGFPDKTYSDAGAQLVADPLPNADFVLKVQPPTVAEVARMKPGATLIGFLNVASNANLVPLLNTRSINAFAMEQMPRITRAQPMDALSAMSTVAGYKAVLIAANRLPRFFPLLMTAAGTVQPARVFIIGAGVAGLQAIGTAKRLGAVVEAYDTRPAVREQVESLGGKFVVLDIAAEKAEAATGYATAQSEEFYRKQRELMAAAIAKVDIVITTALVPGKKAPILVTEEMVRGMRPGSVIVDLAAEQGGNCELTQAGQEVVKHGVIIIGPVNIASTVAFHASQMYARTVVSYLLHLFQGGALKIDLADDLTKLPLVTNQGQILQGSGGTAS